MSIKNALRELLNNLDKIYETHGENGDTEVRQHSREAIDNYFVNASPGDDFPLSGKYEMFTEEGDQEIYKALGQFLNHPETRAALANLTPQEREDAFDDAEVESLNGSNYAGYFGASWHP